MLILKPQFYCFKEATEGNQMNRLKSEEDECGAQAYSVMAQIER